MPSLQQVSLVQRLVGVSVLVGLALALAIGAAGWQLRQAVQLTQQLERQRLPQLLRAESAELQLTRASLQLRHAMLARNPAEQQQALADLGRYRQRFEADLTAFRDGLFTPAGREAYAAVPPLTERFLRLAEANVARIQAGERDAAFAQLADEIVPVRNELLVALERLKGLQSEALARDVARIGSGVDRTLAQLAVSGVAVLALLLLTCWLISRRLRARAQDAVLVARRVRDGDLREPVADPRRDEFSRLLAALDEMQTGLGGVVRSVRDNADALALTGQALLNDSQSLATRTGEAAEALHAANATTLALGEAVHQGDAHAQQAHAQAQQAAGVAEAGGQAVQQVVHSMQGIADSARRIADITSEIDGIAFQTNILALNAAVEAARAGEAGRGFAVVAGEVRSLAQRAAAAAKEIKQLIGTSVARVEAGSQQADGAGRTMQQVVDAIHAVSASVAAISAASAEQARRVDALASMVRRVDEGTQDNQLLVQRSSASARQLDAQAAQLQQAVGAFRL